MEIFTSTEIIVNKETNLLFLPLFSDVVYPVIDCKENKEDDYQYSNSNHGNDSGLKF